MKKLFGKIKITKENVITFLLMNVGTIMASSGVYFFKSPNNFVTGGVSGISIILRAAIPGWNSLGMMVTGISVFLLIVGIIVLGRRMGLQTIYCSLLFSGFMWGMEYIYPVTESLTGDVILDMLFAVVLSAGGGAILFNCSASTGGTDIITMIVKKYSNFNITTSMLMVEFLIALCSGFATSWKQAAYSVMALVIQVAVQSTLLSSLNHNKQVTVITSHPKGVCDYVSNELHRGATVIRGLGAYTGELRYLVITVLTPAQAAMVKRKVKEFDEAGFVIITNTTDIIGHGFRRQALDFADSKSLMDKGLDKSREKMKEHEKVHQPASMPQHHEVPDFDLATMRILGIVPPKATEESIAATLDSEGTPVEEQNAPEEQEPQK